MANQAAIVPSAKAPLEVKSIEKYTPGEGEILVKNEVISFNPVEAKIARLGLLPVIYPFIPGLSYGGTVEAVGQGVTELQAGDKVTVRRSFAASGNQYGSFQKFVLARSDTTSKLPNGVDLTVAASLIGNLTTTIGLFNVRAGLERPTLADSVPSKNRRILIYGGSSSVGSLSIQWVAQAGYQVVTTSSPRNKDFVSKLGAVAVIDHTQPQDALVRELVAQGPYDLVADMISSPPTIAVNAAVLEAQGGGDILATLPNFAPETLPEGVKRVFGSWPDIIATEDTTGVEEWAYRTYFPQSLAKGKLIPQPSKKINGGLGDGVNKALDLMITGDYSGVKLIADPWE
jgi:NADPH:quinone reductase-like Zn-dependent oxidoreductase